jgi:hypothetical protein
VRYADRVEVALIRFYYVIGSKKLHNRVLAHAADDKGCRRGNGRGCVARYRL